MGMTPAKMFNPPTPFGSTPKTNNVTEAQPLAMNQGPGFAALSGFDQTQANPAVPQNPAFPMRRLNVRGDSNPFLGLLNQ